MSKAAFDCESVFLFWVCDFGFEIEEEPEEEKPKKKKRKKEEEEPEESEEYEGEEEEPAEEGEEDLGFDLEDESESEEEEASELSPVEKIISDKYGDVGLKVYALIDGQRTAEEIMQETGLTEPKLVEILDFMDAQGIIKLDYPKASISTVVSQYLYFHQVLLDKNCIHR